MITHPLTLSVADGHVITGHRYLPAEPTGVLVISHGMAEHGDRYRELAQWLATRGLVVVTYHHRGHGPKCPQTQLGHYANRRGWQSVVNDLAQVVEAARKQHPGLPINLLGHSMGSFIAQYYAQQSGDRIDTLLLSATNRIHRPQLIALRAFIRLVAPIRGWQHRSRLLRQITFGQFNRAFRPNRTESDWLSRDTEQVDRYEADPACGFDCTIGLWHDFTGGMLGIRPATWRRDLPVHLFSGTADAVGEMGAGVRRHFQAIREAGMEQVTLRLFDGGRHEMLNESNREEVWQYMLTLCRRHSPTRSKAGNAPLAQLLP
ncbi:alpha/beta hydrolase [Marinobacter sp. VGCF2001]|uniref:alpha/beta hydrolase n=1 Tax=Marinobacter sp. VGCF2001 TaxID=3417189 RepID=UPI003CEBEB6B